MNSPFDPPDSDASGKSAVPSDPTRYHAGAWDKIKKNYAQLPEPVCLTLKHFREVWAEFAAEYTKKNGPTAGRALNLLSELAFDSDNAGAFIARHEGELAALKEDMGHAAEAFGEFCFQPRYYVLKDVLQDCLADLWIKERGPRGSKSDNEKNTEAALTTDAGSLCASLLYKANYLTIKKHHGDVARGKAESRQATIRQSTDHQFYKALRNFDPQKESSVGFAAYLKHNLKRYIRYDEGRILEKEQGKLKVVGSLDKPIGKDGTWGELFGDSRQKNPLDLLIRDENIAAVRQALETLPQFQRQVMTLRFGLDGGGPRNYPEMKTKLGESVHSIQRAEQLAMKRLEKVLSVNSR